MDRGKRGEKVTHIVLWTSIIHELVIYIKENDFNQWDTFEVFCK